MMLVSAVGQDDGGKGLNGRIGAHLSWARTSDRSARTKPARDMFLEKFERQVDPEGILPEKERRQRAMSARKAYMLKLAKRSAMARRIKAGMETAEAEAAPGRAGKQAKAEPDAELFRAELGRPGLAIGQPKRSPGAPDDERR